MSKPAQVSSSAQKRRTLEEAVDAAMTQYRLDAAATSVKIARLRALREARDAQAEDGDARS
ncbi:hypothetical protein ACLBXM_06920 [Xanthobacteraceae bacterium A53D]